MQPLPDIDLFTILWIQCSVLDIHLRMHARYNEPKRRLVISIDAFGWSGVVSTPSAQTIDSRNLSLISDNQPPQNRYPRVLGHAQKYCLTLSLP
jgi:hypothetical protein